MTGQAEVDSQQRVLRFRTGAAMPARLGAEQLKDETTAVIELVKNAYDADATEVTVEFSESDGQKIVIQDNGSGMTENDLSSKWMWLATENKVREDRSPIFRRRRLGQKGVGRFAAQKLGHKLILRTRAEGLSHVLKVAFDWDELDDKRELSDYTFPVKSRKPDNFEPSHGTRLIIYPLRAHWKKARLQKLRDQLAYLIDPETTATDFKIRFQTPWPDLNGPLENPLAGIETHRLEFQITADGREELLIHVQNIGTDRRSSQAIPPAFGSIRGRLRYYGQGLTQSARARGGDSDADWNVGVRIFRDGCRVRPYGEPGPEGDWLQIYRMRYLKGSRFRLKPHYLEGTIHISKDDNPLLRDTTSREGLTENDAYSGLIEYVKDKIACLSDLLREEELREERSRLHERYDAALEPLTAGLSQVRSEEYRSAVESADKQMRRKLLVQPIAIVLNTHWECLDCHDSWKVPKELSPACCRQFSVGRDGASTNKHGCGSTNIRRKENVRSGESPGSSLSLEDVMTGTPAYVSGIQLRPIIDWEMGENDDEAEVREDRRQLAVNGRHQAFRAADALDGNVTVEGTTLEALRGVAALTIHVVDAASSAWGRWHCKREHNDFEVFRARYAELKSACLSNLTTSEDQSMALTGTR